MQINVAKLLTVKDGQEWVEYKDGFELLLRFATAEEQRQFSRRKSKGPGAGVSDHAARDFWCSHVLDWRGLLDGSEPVAFDRKLLNLLWETDASFGAWLVEGCTQLDTFLVSDGDAPAVAVRAVESAPAA